MYASRKEEKYFDVRTDLYQMELLLKLKDKMV
jgi:hypothetical protein